MSVYNSPQCIDQARLTFLMTRFEISLVYCFRLSLLVGLDSAEKITPTAAASTTQKRNLKEKRFITRTAHISVELNAHSLLYLVLLVKQKQLSKEALSIFLFSSQSCESLFRDTRSLSGTYSSMTNSTVFVFLLRSQKSHWLNDIKCDQLSEEDNKECFSFPAHYKHKQDSQLSSLQY